MSDEIQTGYLVLADLSGYTSYLAGVELDHAHEMLTDLLETILDSFEPVLTISKKERALSEYRALCLLVRLDMVETIVDGTERVANDGTQDHQSRNNNDGYQNKN